MVVMVRVGLTYCGWIGACVDGKQERAHSIVFYLVLGLLLVWSDLIDNETIFQNLKKNNRLGAESKNEHRMM